MWIRISDNKEKGEGFVSELTRNYQIDIGPEAAERKRKAESIRKDTKRNGVKYAVSFCRMDNPT